MTDFNHVITKSATQLSVAGNSDFLEVDSGAKSASVVITPDTASSLVIQVNYSTDKSTEAEISTTYAIPDGSIATRIPVAIAYKYVRIEWVSGTATTVDIDLDTNILG